LFTATCHVQTDNGSAAGCPAITGIRRENVLDESMNLLSKASAMVMRRRLRVDFVDEPGIDGGGILREWLQLLCQELFAESRGLFATANSSQHHGYWIKRTNDTQPARLQVSAACINDSSDA
jgi:hypothetical protein